MFSTGCYLMAGLCVLLASLELFVAWFGSQRLDASLTEKLSATKDLEWLRSTALQLNVVNAKLIHMSGWTGVSYLVVAAVLCVAAFRLRKADNSQ